MLRGYLSFLLLIPLAFLLLTPLLARPSSPPTTAFYLTEQTMNEQLAFKRALLVSAHQTILSLKTQIITLPKLLEASTTLSCPLPTTTHPTFFFDLTIPEQRCLSRYETLRVWADTSQNWSEHSDYTTSIICADDSSPAACSQFLTYSHLSGTLVISPGINISLHHKDLGSNATSQLPSIEVGGAG